VGSALLNLEPLDSVDGEQVGTDRRQADGENLAEFVRYLPPARQKQAIDEREGRVLALSTQPDARRPD
jgi:hypothetical protein